MLLLLEHDLLLLGLAQPRLSLAQTLDVAFLEPPPLVPQLELALLIAARLRLQRLSLALPLLQLLQPREGLELLRVAPPLDLGESVVLLALELEVRLRGGLVRLPQLRGQLLLAGPEGCELLPLLLLLLLAELSHSQRRLLVLSARLASYTTE